MNKRDYFVSYQKIRDAIPENKHQEFDIQFASKKKSETVALVLSLFFGMFGVDRIYIGSPLLGVVKALTLGGLGIWNILDWFLIMGAARDRNIDIAYKTSRIAGVHVAPLTQKK